MSSNYTTERKPDRLDYYLENRFILTPEEKAEARKIRAEYERIEAAVLEWTKHDATIMLGFIEGGEFTYTLPTWARWLKCESADLLAVLRRMKEKKRVKYVKVQNDAGTCEYKHYKRRWKRGERDSQRKLDGLSEVVQRFGCSGFSDDYEDE